MDKKKAFEVVSTQAWVSQKPADFRNKFFSLGKSRSRGAVQNNGGIMRVCSVGTFLILGALLFGTPHFVSIAAQAQEEKSSGLNKEQLDQLLAPIALYPDDLLTSVLVASTYPLEVVQAARWRKDPANAKLSGDALTKALESKDWDPSVKSLVQFPDVLQQMSDQLEWTQKLGDAFLAQQDEVMDQIQSLRAKAAEAGNLKSNEQQKVTKQSGSGSEPIYVIQPANPEVVYVPVYEPTVVYGSWSYPSYPPYYWPPPGAALVNGFFWGAGIAIANEIWDWGDCDWGHHDIDIDVNKWNNINVNRDQIKAGKWEHNPAHRGAVPYKNKEVRDKYKGADRELGSKEFRGREPSGIDRSKIEGKLKDTDHSNIKNKAAGGASDKIKDRPGDSTGQKIKDRPGDSGGGQKVKDRAGDGGGGQKVKNKVPDRSAGGKIEQPKAKKPSPAAFDVKHGADVKRSADRGHASRGGGGGHRGGGGGGHRR